MATLIKNHDRWYLQFYDPERRPKRKRVALKTTDKREAQKHQRRLEKAYNDCEYDPWRDDPRTLEQKDEKPLTVAETFDRFLAQSEREGKSPNTLRSYRAMKRQFGATVGEDTLLRSVESSDVERFVRDGSVKPNTQDNRYRHVRAVFAWARREKLLARDPFEKVMRPKKEATLPKAVRPDELEAVCAERPDLASLYWFAYFTGMRSSELARLRWSDIDRERGLIYITKQKNHKAQSIPLNSKAAEVLDDVEHIGEHVFRSEDQTVRTFVDTVSQAFLRAKRRAGIERKVTVHGLRHGFGTRLAEAGKSAVVIKEAMRHASIQTSMIYVSYANEALKAEIEDVFA